MTPEDVAERAQRIAGVRARRDADRSAIRSAMVFVRQVAAWAEAQNAALIRQLEAVDSFPEATIAEASKSSISEASKSKERADTLGAAPSIAKALEGGSITAGHVDAITRSSNRLEPAHRTEFVDRAEALVGVAAAGSVEEFARRLNIEVKQIQSDDGEERLARQRRNVRLNTWTDNDGMRNVRGRFDPVIGIQLAQRLDSTVQTLFAEQTPELCPSNPVEKSKFLAAHALARLLSTQEPGAGKSTPPEIGQGVGGAGPEQSSWQSSTLTHRHRAGVALRPAQQSSTGRFRLSCRQECSQSSRRRPTLPASSSATVWCFTRPAR